MYKDIIEKEDIIEQSSASEPVVYFSATTAAVVNNILNCYGDLTFYYLFEFVVLFLVLAASLFSIGWLYLDRRSRCRRRRR